MALAILRPSGSGTPTGFPFVYYNTTRWRCWRVFPLIVARATKLRDKYGSSRIYERAHNLLGLNTFRQTGDKPVRLAIASAFRPAPEGRCDGEVVWAASFAELELKSGNTVLFAARS